MAMPILLCRLQWAAAWSGRAAALFAVAIATAASSATIAAEHAETPNIILCLADDLGYGDTSYNGHEFLRTPHLDAMAAAGIRFNRFYAASAVCSPTRGSCLTGRHPSRYGITTANAGHLRSPEICLAEVLKAKGYATGHFGKWHLGTLTPDYSGKGPGRKPRENYMTPGMAGFDEWFSTEYAVATWDPYDPDHAHNGVRDPRALYWHNGQNIADGAACRLSGCDSRIVMNRALPFIEKAAGAQRPFFAVIWFHAPHEPVIGGPEYLKRFEGQPEKARHYYAVVTALDDQIGRLRQRLRELGVADNTLLWFASDNGPEHATGPGSTAGLRGRKRSLYEGGIRVPGIVEWPAKIRQPRATDFPAVTSDYFPTILEIVGESSTDELPASTGENRPYDGISLLPVLEGKLKQRPEPIAFQYQRQAALVDNRFKLVADTRLNKLELYDLSADRTESNNVAQQHPDVVQTMRARLAAWLESCEASSRGEDYPR